MSACKHCGQEVRWAVHPESKKYMPPLERVEKVFILSESTGKILQREAWRFHVCRADDPDRMRAALNRRYAIETTEEKEQKREVAELLERLHQEKISKLEADYARKYIGPIKIDCRRCGRKKGKKCKNLSPTIKDVRDAKIPHPERKADWMALQTKKEMEVLEGE